MTPAEALRAAMPDAVEEASDAFVRVKAEKIVEAARVLREKCGAEMLHQISGVDRPPDKMEVVYHFARLKPAEFLCLKVSVPRSNPVVPTLAHEWASANWGERETLDLLGVTFSGHPHPYRILLPEDWEGHPLRKDYAYPVEYHGVDCVE